jgi:hypothetical protein
MPPRKNSFLIILLGIFQSSLFPLRYIGFLASFIGPVSPFFPPLSLAYISAPPSNPHIFWIPHFLVFIENIDFNTFLRVLPIFSYPVIFGHFYPNLPIFHVFSLSKTLPESYFCPHRTPISYF